MIFNYQKYGETTTKQWKLLKATNLFLYILKLMLDYDKYAEMEAFLSSQRNYQENAHFFLSEFSLITEQLISMFTLRFNNVISGRLSIRYHTP